nr:MAG TPA: hypothetical protein [Caudoviricetes sp.]
MKFFDILPKKKQKLEFSINYSENCSLEVELYGY